jgi:hypothetical protein
MKPSYLKSKSFWDKVFKLTVYFQILILLLALLKSFLNGGIDGLTMMGFIKAVLISFVGGFLAGLSIAYKDETS